jgi:hypothetical protein
MRPTGDERPALNKPAHEEGSIMTTTDSERSLEAIGKSQYESIVDMVSALECDYGRLEELKSETETLEDALRTLDAAEDYDGDTRDSVQNDLLDLREELAELQVAGGECSDQDEARERIQEDPLSVEVRSGWVSIGTEMEAEEFVILIGTGGPATRIRGELDQYKQPSRAWLEVQDWGTPWTRYFDADQETLLTYCREFYFGE